MTFERPMRVDNFHVEDHGLDYVRFRSQLREQMYVIGTRFQ